MSIIDSILARYAKFKRRKKNKYDRSQMKNQCLSIISSNCNGGVMLNDLGLIFDSPFVNLWIKPKDYLKLLKDLKGYLSKDLCFITDKEYTYPVAQLGDINIYFQHYKSEEDAKACWQRRVKRIHWDNIYVLFSDRDGCTNEDLIEFDKLPYEHKVVFTHIKQLGIKSAFYISGFEKENQVGVLSEWRNPLKGERYIDEFNYVEWLNNNV